MSSGEQMSDYYIAPVRLARQVFVLLVHNLAETDFAVPRPALPKCGNVRTVDWVLGCHNLVNSSDVPDFPLRA